MIGNGIAALSSTTALAPTGGQARGSGGSDGGFAETLDQALKDGSPSASGKGEAKASETASANPGAGPAQQGDVFAAARWRNVAGEGASTEPQDAVATETGEEKAASDTETVEVVISPEELADGATEENQGDLEAGDGEGGPTPPAEPTDVDRELAAAAVVSGDKDPTEEPAKKAVGTGEAPPAAPASAAPETGSVSTDTSASRKAGETAVASVEAARPGKTASSAHAGSPAIDDAPPAKGTVDADGKTTVQSGSDGASGKTEPVAARQGASTVTPPAAQDRTPANAQTRSPELNPNVSANTTGKAEQAAAPEAPRDTAAKPVTATTRSDLPPTQTAPADKPVPTAPVLQMAQGAAAPGKTSASGQVAEAVARDLEELAPTRVTVSASGAPGRPIRSIQLQLNPAELGTVNIRLHSVDGQLRVAIRAESDKTADMLSRDSDAIRSALRAAGISSSEITVSVNRHDQAMQQQFTGQNRDTSGQLAGQDNRGNMSNESKNPNRDHPSGNTPGPLGRGNADSGDADGGDRLFI